MKRPCPAGMRAIAALLVATALMSVPHGAFAASAADRDAARAAAARRDFATALPLYRALAAAAGGDADLLIEAARVHGFADDNAAAARLYRQALAAAPARRMDIVPSLAWQSLWSGDVAAARTLFDELAAAPDADRADALDGRGQALQALGDLPAAVAALREAHALRPDDARLHRRLASALLWSDRHAEAVTELRTLRARHPGDRDVGWALANALNLGGRHREALALFATLGAPRGDGERLDHARAWYWAGYGDRALPLLHGATEADVAWLREARIARERKPQAAAGYEYAVDRDRLAVRAATVGAALPIGDAGAVELQARRATLDEGVRHVDGESLALLARTRLGEPQDAPGTWWPTLALRSHRYADWSPLTAFVRVRGVPADRWRVDAELGRELIETPRALAARVHVDAASGGVDHRPDARTFLHASGALLRFDDGTRRWRTGLRAEYALGLRPRWAIGVEASRLQRETADVPDRGYWNPRRYDELRLYGAFAYDARPWEVQARLGLGRAREVEAGGNVVRARPDQWEAAVAYDVSPGLALRAAAGRTGQGLTAQGADYWRRYALIGLQAWF